MSDTQHWHAAHHIVETDLDSETISVEVRCSCGALGRIGAMVTQIQWNACLFCGRERGENGTRELCRRCYTALLKENFEKGMVVYDD